MVSPVTNASAIPKRAVYISRSRASLFYGIVTTPALGEGAALPRRRSFVPMG